MEGKAESLVAFTSLSRNSLHNSLSASRSWTESRPFTLFITGSVNHASRQHGFSVSSEKSDSTDSAFLIKLYGGLRNLCGSTAEHSPSQIESRANQT